MRSSLLDYLVCPMGCSAPLSLSRADYEGREIQSAALSCERCGREWPVEEGIPRLLPDALAVVSGEGRNAKGESQPESGGRQSASTSRDEKQVLRSTQDDGTRNDPTTLRPDDPTTDRQRAEMAARDEQAADYDRMWHLNLFGLLEVPVTLLNMDLGAHHLLLEGGCGTGRMTRQFASRCREVVSVDFSFESLRACRRKLQAAGACNVHLIQADLCHLPLRTELFDRVVSCQVLEHIPTDHARTGAVGELSRVLRPGGNLTLSAYQYSLLMRLFGQKEGEHAGGIYFYRFTRDELRELLAPWVQVESMTGALVYHYIARCRK